MTGVPSGARITVAQSGAHLFAVGFVLLILKFCRPLFVHFIWPLHDLS